MSQELHITCIWLLLKWVVGLTEGWVLSETLYKIQNFYQSKLIWESHSPCKLLSFNFNRAKINVKVACLSVCLKDYFSYNSQNGFSQLCCDLQYWLLFLLSSTSYVDDEEKSSEEKHDCDKLSATVSGDALKDSTTSNALKLFKSSESDSCPEILHGEPFTDRKSTFQAHLAHVVTADQVKQVLEELKKNRKVNNGTHNVMAYRIFCENRNSFLQDCDDDGEAAAGSRLLHLLQILNIKNIIIVVTRWYGGILLGPDRFKHYNNCARGLLKNSGLVDISPDLKDSKSKSRFKIKKH